MFKAGLFSLSCCVGGYRFSPFPLTLSSASDPGCSGRLPSCRRWPRWPAMGGKEVWVLLARLLLFFFLLNKVVVDRPAFLSQLRALAMVDGAAAIGGGLELRSSVPWPDLVRPLQDSTVCRYPRDSFSGTMQSSGIFKASGEENPLVGWLLVYFSLTSSCEGFNQRKFQVQFSWLIVSGEDSDLLFIRYLKLNPQLVKDQINVQVITHPSMEVDCVLAATFDEAAVCVGWAPRCPSTCKWLQLLSSGFGNVSCIFLLEFEWNGCSCITSTSSSRGLYHLFYLVGYMRNYLCCLVTMVVDTALGDEICKPCYGVSEANLIINHKASLFAGEVNLSQYCLCCIWIKNGFEDVLEESVKAFSFGSFHRRRVRSLLLLDPRFNGRHDPWLSSVRHTKNLQLNTLQPRVQKPIRSLGEPPGYYRRAQWPRPSRIAVVVARRCSRPIRHQAPLVVFTHSILELLLELCICMLQSHVLATLFVGVSHPVNVL